VSILGITNSFKLERYSKKRSHSPVQDRANKKHKTRSRRGRQKNLLQILDDLKVLYPDLNTLIVEYDITPIELKTKLKYRFGWLCIEKNKHFLHTLVSDNQILYLSCPKHDVIYCYSSNGNLLHSLPYKAYAMEIVNSQLFFLDDSKLFIVDIKLNSIIQSWDLPKEQEGSVGGWYVKISDKIYFTLLYHTHCLSL